MGRKTLYDKQKFLKAYKKAKSVKELAGILQVSIPTVFNYISRHKVKPYKSAPDPLPYTLAKAFTFNNTIKDLSIKFKLSQSVVRYHLNKFVLYPVQYHLTLSWSPPKKISHIKVINALMSRRKVVDNPRVLLRLPGMTKYLVEDYWLYATGLTLESYEEKG